MTLPLLVLFFIMPVGYYLWKLLYFRNISALFLPIGGVLTVLSGYLLYTQNQEMIAAILTISASALLLTVIHVDKHFKVFRGLMFLSTGASFITVICIVACLILKSKLFFSKVAFSDFILGTTWNPSTEIADSQIMGSFGVLPLLCGTLLIVIIAITLALPLGLLSAIYISEYSSKRIRRAFNTLLEILCGIPTVVYGYFAVVFLSPNIRSFANFCGLNAQSENALVAGLAIGIMILPFMTLLMENALRSVPKILRYGSMALGATRAETIWNIVVPCALPNICSSVILSVSRVIGETMIVLMAAGVTANLTFNPLHSVTTITVQIATILTGDQNFQNIHTSSAYALGLALFIITWILNLIAAYITRKTHKSLAHA